MEIMNHLQNKKSNNEEQNFEKVANFGIPKVAKFEIVSYDQFKKDINRAVANVNTAMVDISTTLNTVNKLTPEKKTELQSIIEDTRETTCNLRKFSEKLNKRFLLWRLMF